MCFGKCHLVDKLQLVAANAVNNTTHISEVNTCNAFDIYTYKEMTSDIVLARLTSDRSEVKCC